MFKYRSRIGTIQREIDYLPFLIFRQRSTEPNVENEYLKEEKRNVVTNSNK